jgi:syndecan 1
VATSGADPHRVLGVAQGATIEEIRRAYRALAKRHHPDAGQGSVARFLEIQAAYEALVGAAAPGSSRRTRGPADSRPAGRRPGDGGPAARPGRRPAQGADPSRSRGAGSGTAAASGTAAGAGWARRPPREGARRAQGTPSGDPAGGPAGGAPGSPEGRPRRPAEPADGRSGRRATFGSTTYDEAEEVFEPGWSGASWYGPTSGTYWTLNPKEYADPRKHGPEYQARGRGTSGAAGGTSGAPGGTSGAPGGTSGAPGGTSGAPGGTRSAGGPGSARAASAGRAADPAAGAATGPSAGPTGRDGATGGEGAAASVGPDGGLPPAWRATWTAGRPQGEQAPPFDHEPAPPRAAPRPAAAPGDAPPFGPADAGGRAVAGMPAMARSEPGTPGVPARLVLAVVGWLPVGLALGSAAGLPGGLVATLPLQVLGLVVLALHPRLAWAAAGGGLALVLAAIPIVALVAALGGPVVPGEPMPVAVVLAALTWGVGLVAVGSGRVAPFPWRRRLSEPTTERAGD